MLKVCFWGLCGGHSRCVFGSEQAVVTGGCRSAEEEYFGWLPWDGFTEYDDCETMLQAERPDILVVDTPFGLHPEGIRLGLKYGCGVLADKPLCTRPEEYAALEALVLGQDRPVWSLQTMRYEAPYCTMRQLVQEGAIGQVRLINARKSYRLGNRAPFYGDHALYGGTMGWVAIHGLDLIRYITPLPVERVYGQTSAGLSPIPTLETTATAMLTMQGGVIGTVTADFLRPSNASFHGDDQLRIVGTDGILEAAHGHVTLLDHRSDTEQEVSLREPEGSLFGDFCRAMDGEATPRLSTKASLEITRLAMLAVQSAESGEAVRV